MLTADWLMDQRLGRASHAADVVQRNSDSQQVEVERRLEVASGTAV
jgi:hypothetical protein